MTLYLTVTRLTGTWCTAATILTITFHQQGQFLHFNDTLHHPKQTAPNVNFCTSKHILLFILFYFFEQHSLTSCLHSTLAVEHPTINSNAIK